MTLNLTHALYAVLALLGGGFAALALSGGDSKPPQPTYPVTPARRFKPEKLLAENHKNLAAARGVTRAEP